MKKLNFSHGHFTAFSVATFLTMADTMIDWNNRIYFGIFAFFISLTVSFIAQKIIKD
ncbi:hypothetical protein M3204_10360 [Mesobacillus subterraneus]|uniref:hypothetical protein n=1 Tax=Mesobacillus subterraneus TaxID=285983 RepID=UPI00203E1A67|nr:hypothetical protein [Mesobacillus subterraneus]MCM3664808.1 hypothetical protein [Mesobacillus subterraneus]MCM3681897.1 hypothetical protein [Mesobacillus subterraneus]